MKRWLTLVLIGMVALIIGACSGNGSDSSNDDAQDNGEEPTEKNEESSQESDSTEDEINVLLHDVDGNEVAEATLTAVDDGVKITLTGDDLSEVEGEHAFHIHEKGVCELDDFESAGGHYNPTDKNHGKEDAEGPHAGDFDNIKVDVDGKIDVEFVTDQISLDPDAENTVFTKDGTSLVIHADPDDYTSQPAGDAGDRIACGVIAEPK